MSTIIKEMSSSRKQLENKVSEVFAEYTYKYMNKVQDKCESSKAFRRALRQITEWDNDKRVREYKKFVKWYKKHGDSIDQLEAELDSFVRVSLRILLNKRVQGKAEEWVKTECNLDAQSLFYKCMRRVARDFHDARDNHLSQAKLQQTIASCLHEFIPVDKLIELIELFDDDSHNQSYDFNKTFSDTVSNSTHKVVVEKEDTNSNHTDVGERSLKYVPSEDIEEYYNSDEDEKKVSVEDDNIKEIKLPKHNNKGSFYYKKRKAPIPKPKIDEAKENFFSE